ncbi:MAG TPA: PP2C family serine/threonine-protein phosphatase [Chthoniobacter sp.]
MSRTGSNGDLRFLVAHSQGPREEQQDAGVCLHNDAEGTALLVVGDGVGGRSGGRIASHKLTELASELWEERKGNFSNPEEDLGTLCRVAHEQINEEGSKLGISPRTTIVALYLTPTRAHWVHSGDSRLYHFRAGQLLERTEDHSLLEMMVQRGAVKEEDMGSHPDQGALLQALGGDEYTPPSVGEAAIGADDGFLLCTDGFWERTKPDEMAELVFGPREAAAERLGSAIDRAVQRNGPKGDNVTAALALPAGQKPASVVPRKSPRGLIFVAAALFLLAIVVLYWPNRKKAAPEGGAAKPASPSVARPSATAEPPAEPVSVPPPVLAPSEIRKVSPDGVKVEEAPVGGDEVGARLSSGGRQR